jgi:hypothetical protein
MGKYRPKGPKTAKVLRQHVKAAAVRRLGVSLSAEQIQDICSAIQKGQAKFHDRQSKIGTRWILPVAGQEMAVVYDSKRHMIRTIMPVAYLEKSKLQHKVERWIKETEDGMVFG